MAGGLDVVGVGDAPLERQQQLPADDGVVERAQLVNFAVGFFG